MGQVAVVTVDDQRVFREAAREVIAATPGFESLGEACSGDEVLSMVAERTPQLALVDVRMPEMDGIEVTRRIKQAYPEVVVVLISIEEQANLPADALSSGAAALVRKQDFGPRLLRELWLAHAPELDPGSSSQRRPPLP
jgi:DNA-binding NarL/FixJ family response regulator